MNQSREQSSDSFTPQLKNGSQASSGIQKMSQNPMIQSMTISDDKPLSSMSLIEEKVNKPLNPNKNKMRTTYQSKNKEFLIENLSKLDNYQQRDYIYGTYYGQIINEKKHGKGCFYISINQFFQGLLIQKEGRICEGQWVNDRKHGYCFEILENGNTFSGEYANGKPQGQGIFVSEKGEKYDGAWVNGYKHGQGVWNGEKGDKYEGDWKFGKIDGIGTYINTNGDKYIGSFRNNMKHGRGIEHFANGDVYNGEYQNAKPHGQGFYLWQNGTEYRGEFKNGVRHGNGKWIKWVMKEPNPLQHAEKLFFSYEGEYENDKKHGQGVFKWPSGNEYKGSFVNDFRHGYGEMYWIDGSYYKGSWEKGFQHGEGELYRKGEGVKKGFFENNNLVEEQARPKSQRKQLKKLVWQSNETEKVNMSCFVLDRTLNDTSMFDMNQNKTFSTLRDAKSHFMPSIARKPLYMAIKQTKEQKKTKFIVNTSSIHQYQSFHVAPFEEDPDFQLRETPNRISKMKGMSHFYMDDDEQKVQFFLLTLLKQQQDLTFSLKKAFIETSQ